MTARMRDVIVTNGCGAVTDRGAMLPPWVSDDGGGEYGVAMTLRERTIDEGRIRPLSFDDVMRMVDAGILTAEDRVELIDGVLVEMSREGIDHWDGSAELNRRLTDAYPATFDVRVCGTHPLDKWQYRVPDFVVAHRIRGRWLRPDDVVLIVEVSNTSLRYDLGRKARDYAAWGVAEHWVVDVVRRRIVVHRDIVEGAYATVVEPDLAEPLALPGVDAVLEGATLFD